MATLDQIADGVVVTDLEGRFLLFNPAAERILRLGAYDEGPTTWSSHYGLFLPDMTTPFPPDELPLYQAMRGRTVGTTEIYMQHKTTPEGVWLSVRATPRLDSQGEVVGGIAVFRDITDQKEAEKELIVSKEAAESASMAKGRFLAAMSHDIRAPLNTIIGMLEVVLASDLEKEQREYLRVVRESSESLLSLIDDLLDYSQIEDGRLTLNALPFSLRDVIGDTLKSLGFQAHTKKLELGCRIGAQVPDNLIGDPNRLRQLIGNLVTNAIKFTNRGGVVLEVTAVSSNGSTANLRFSVRDTGIGIAPEHQKRIFAPYDRGDARVARTSSGTGLGLAIAREIVQLMGGELTLESTLGEGSTFRFTIPLAIQADRQEGPPEGWDAWQGRHILVVDDHEFCRQILQELLEEWGLRVSTAVGAEEALLVAESDRPDAALIDAEMPRRDGFWLAERLSTGHPGIRRVMMLASSYQLGDMAHCERLGVEAFLQKPIKHSELREALILAARGEKTIRHVSKRESAHPRRILLAEDSLVNQKLAGAILEGWGHRVLFANNGKEAVALAESQSVDLILMDVEMPEMDGLDATRVIRENENSHGRRVPIFGLTAHYLETDRQRCRDAGMDEVILKPFDIDGLFRQIEEARQLDSTERKSPAPGS
jgi:signal transduction histidine kinase/DNA-binding response OmpR family regulator